MATKQERIAELMAQSQLLAVETDVIRAKRQKIKTLIMAIEAEPDPVSTGEDAVVEGQTLTATSPT